MHPPLQWLTIKMFGSPFCHLPCLLHKPYHLQAYKLGNVPSCRIRLRSTMAAEYFAFCRIFSQLAAQGIMFTKRFAPASKNQGDGQWV
jgi:hypothetical protein